jgi:pimeloyl-ACP methyl ester carboxylesterase
VTDSLHWRQRVGSQRDWVWRGWQTRYTYLRAIHAAEDDPPLVLLHGFGTSIGHWRHNLTELSQHHTVYALDMLGFGASEKAIAHYNISLWVEQVYEFWQTFIRKPIVLIGNSIGSLVCLAAAATHPDMVKGVVMISLPDLSLEEEATPKFLRPVVAAVKGMILSPWLLKSLFPLLRRPNVVRPWAAIAYANPEAVTEELVEILVGPAQDRGSAQAFCAILRAMTSPQFSPRVKTILQDLDIPLLLIWGKEDRMIPKKFAQPDQYVRCNAKLQLVELENAGHCPHDEQPEVVNQVVVEWLRSWTKGNNIPQPSVLGLGR